MLEAVILVPALGLGLYGLLYFRELYTSMIGSARLARAAVVAHGMAACKEPGSADWIDRDLGPFRIDFAGEAQLPAKAAEGGDSCLPSDTPGSSWASSVLGSSISTGGDSKGLFNPVTSMVVAGRVGISPRHTRPFYEAPRTIFTSRIQSESFVSCSDKVRDGGFGQIIGIVQDELSSLLRR